MNIQWLKPAALARYKRETNTENTVVTQSAGAIQWGAAVPMLVLRLPLPQRR